MGAVLPKGVAALAKLLDAAHRSKAFFAQQLAALAADGECRECCICLEEDIPVEELSVLPCAHVRSFPGYVL